MRGSAKHILDLLDSADYIETMNRLLSDAGATITSDDAHRPLGWDAPSEWPLHVFCAEHCRDWFDQEKLTSWWPGGRPPQWDLISTCTVGDRRGILLVEAKAHEGECTNAGKELEPDASNTSERNHRQIKRCLRQAQESLNRAGGGAGAFRLNTRSRYQLANRVAHLWKLASLGIPTVLLYLGFTGDTYFESDYLIDGAHWQRVMGAYMNRMVPLGFPGHWAQVSKRGSAILLIKSLAVGISSANEVD